MHNFNLYVFKTTHKTIDNKIYRENMTYLYYYIFSNDKENEY